MATKYFTTLAIPFNYKQFILHYMHALASSKYVEDIREVYLFGSCVTEKTGAYSDVDLLVVFKQEHEASLDLLEKEVIRDLRKGISSTYKVAADIRTVEADEFDTSEDDGMSVFSSVHREGIILYKTA